MTFDCAIIGAGPAGIIAALQLSRSGHRVVLFEKNRIGGLLWNANWVENYLGFPEGISGSDLVKRFNSQLRGHSIQIEFKVVTRVARSSVFQIQTEDSNFQARSVLVTAGTIPKSSGIRGESELEGNKLFYEIADLPLAESPMDVLVIGGGDAAFDSAIHLKSLGHNPSVFCRGEPKPLPLLYDRARNAGIPAYPGVEFKALAHKGKRVVLTIGAGLHSADLVLVAVGREPAGLEVPVKGGQGLFFAGDIVNGTMRQVHVATGDGMRAALEISHYLSHENSSGIR